MNKSQEDFLGLPQNLKNYYPKIGEIVVTYKALIKLWKICLKIIWMFEEYSYYRIFYIKKHNLLNYG